MDKKPSSNTMIIIVGVIFVLYLFSQGYRVKTVTINIFKFINVEMVKEATPIANLSVPTALHPKPSSPSEAVYYYFGQLSEGNYDITWNLLTDNFKSIHNADGFDPYKAYWVKVDEVTVTHVSVIHEDANIAEVLADLEFHMVNKQSIPEPGMIIDMIYDENRQQWLIDATRFQ